MTVHSLSSSNYPRGNAIDRRYIVHESVHVDTVPADADEIDMSRLAGGSVSVPVGSALTSLTIYGATGVGGTYAALYDQDGNAVSLTVAASRHVELPSEVYACGSIKLVGDADGTVDLVLKG
jgi:hypothetical protein